MTRQFKRAEAMVIADKFNLHSDEFFAELRRLVGRYMEYDGLTVQLQRADANLIITVSVKKVKPNFSPEA